MSEIIAHLFTISIWLSFVPTQWKQANIIPIPKTQCPSNPLDFRPVALTSALCKVLERIMTSYILKYTKHIWANNKQYGFLPKRNTMDAIIKVIEDWEWARDQKLAIHAIFFDFAKAFESIDHEILLALINELLPNWLTSWIAAYLSKRQQRVKVGDKTSAWAQVEAGVTQGSVIGPMLFLMFIISINTAISSTVELIKYADDLLTYIIMSINNQHTIQETIDGIHKWAKDHKMKLNISKTQSMIVNPQFQPPSTSTKVTLDNQELKQVDHYKYLGETIDKDLSFEEHWNVLYPKLLSQLYVLREMKSLGFNKQVLITIYKAMSLSLINYSAPVLVNTNNTIKQEIKWVQQRALSIIGIDMQEANAKYEILPILDQIDKECIKIVTNIISDPDHPITKKLPTRSKDEPCTRSQTDNNKAIYVANHAITNKYQNRCLQKLLTTLTNGYEDK